MESKSSRLCLFFFVPPYLGSVFSLFAGPRLAIGPGQRRFVVGLGSWVFFGAAFLGVVIYVKSPPPKKKQVVGYYSYSPKISGGKISYKSHGDTRNLVEIATQLRWQF